MVVVGVVVGVVAVVVLVVVVVVVVDINLLQRDSCAISRGANPWRHQGVVANSGKILVFGHLPPLAYAWLRLCLCSSYRNALNAVFGARTK